VLRQTIQIHGVKSIRDWENAIWHNLYVLNVSTTLTVVTVQRLIVMAATVSNVKMMRIVVLAIYAIIGMNALKVVVTIVGVLPINLIVARPQVNAKNAGRLHIVLTGSHAKIMYVFGRVVPKPIPTAL